MVWLLLFAGDNLCFLGFCFHNSIESIVITAAAIRPEKDLYRISLDGKFFCGFCRSTQFSAFGLAIVASIRGYIQTFI